MIDTLVHAQMVNKHSGEGLDPVSAHPLINDGDIRVYESGVLAVLAKKNYPSPHVTPWSIRLKKEIGIRYSTNRDQYELGGICTGESIVETFSNRSEWFTKPKLTVSIVKKNGYLPQKIRPKYVGGGLEPTVVFCVLFIYFQ